ncbi:MAG: transglutaminase-like domain-containing protein [Pirellula sp.]|jgi:hypothetical protein|nr:transglutaminase-like domain-containing protein [Pirellula sp.]
MEYFVSERNVEEKPCVLPFTILLAVACMSSLGVSARFWFADGRSLQRLVDYQTFKLLSPPSVQHILGCATAYVHRLTEHSSGRDLAIWENWTQWLVGQFYSPILRTQNPRWIVAGGRGDCSERAAVLQDLLGYHGIETRFVGLGGHVVLEAKTEAGTWVLDPDYGISMDLGIEQLQQQPTGQVAAELIRRGMNVPSSVQYEQLILTDFNNIPSDWNAPLSPRLKKLEEFCEIAFWLVPAVSWLFVVWMVVPFRD